LLTALENAAEASDAGFVRKRQSLVPCFTRAGENVEFECYLYLKDWTWRATKSNERVNILVHAKERMSRDGTMLIASAVLVSYFQVTEGKATLLHSMHFDYGSPQVCHPIFHAQLTSEPLTLPEDEALELDCDLEISDGRVSCFKNARIPTCDMTLSSVLLCLAADHIKREFFDPLRTELKGIQSELPRPTFAALNDSLRNESNHLRSSHWFAHHGEL
jgi:hypothetical protein